VRRLPQAAAQLPEGDVHGDGGEGGPDTASRMFSAQVSCNGCHTRSVEAKESGVSFPGESKLAAERQSCVACHGKRYDLMLDDWVRESRNLVADMERIVAAGKAPSGAVRRPTGSFPRRGRSSRTRQANLNFLRAGRGAHNIEYALKIVRVGHEQVTAAFKLAGAAGGPPKPGDPRLTVGVLRHPVPLPRDAVGQGFLPGDGAPVPPRAAREGRGDRVREVPLPPRSTRCGS